MPERVADHVDRRPLPRQLSSVGVPQTVSVHPAVDPSPGGQARQQPPDIAAVDRAPGGGRARRQDLAVADRLQTALALAIVMTAKEKLRLVVEELSESEASEALDLIVGRRGAHDALTQLLESAPLDDEPTTLEEEAGVREAREQLARGELISAEQIRREFA